MVVESSGTCVSYDGGDHADAYWALFWSDGKSGTWKYSDYGVTSLDIPKGGSVAFVFQDSKGTDYPDVKPTTASATATPTPSATRQPTTAAPNPAPSPSASPTTRRSASPTATATTIAPSATASASATPSITASPTDLPTTTPTDEAGSASDSSDASISLDDLGPAEARPGHTVITGLAIAMIILLGAGAAVAVWMRRR